MGNFACNDGGPQRTLRSIVGWLHGRVVEKAEHPPSIVLSANTIQQSLVVVILQDSVPHWERGRWEIPPREHAVWVAPRFRHRHDGYVFVDGRWR